MTFLNRILNRSEPPPDDPAIHAYLAHFRNAIPKNVSTRDLTFVVLDTETTGLDPTRNQVISIACFRVKYSSLDLSDSFEIMIRRSAYHPGGDVRIHGILAKHNATGLSERDALLYFLEFIQANILVGHHIDFDLRFLNRSLKQHFGLILKNKVLDTAALAARLEKPVFEKAGTESLDILCHRYGIAPLQRHTATGDAYMTAILFMKLLGRLEKRGVRTYRDLL